QIGFNRGKTRIENFALNNGEQELSLNGIISNSPEDVLALGLENFKLATINPFIKTLGIQLTGNANGTTKIHSVLKSPVVIESMYIDSLGFNGRYIGYLSDISSFNKTDKMVEIS